MPFLKWIGGKTQLLPAIREHLPFTENKVFYNTYHEPFLGGGAVFLDRAPQLWRACLNDGNAALMTTWRTLRAHPRLLIDDLLFLQQNLSREAYELNRAQYNLLLRDVSADSDPYVRLAALFIYLNKTCFNGLYRVNKRGAFNAPWGKRPNAKIFDHTLLDIHELLDNLDVSFTSTDFAEALDRVEAKDFVYLDPPYPSVSGKKDGFTAFTSLGFGDEEQLRLAHCVRELSGRGALFLLSLPDQEYVRQLYRGFNQHPITARRSVNRDGAGRGPVQELLINNY